jgi:membrane-bound lytic murein transglycosylase D
MDIDRHPERYFGPLKFDGPQATDLIAMPHSLDLNAAAKASGVPREELATLNPALGSRIVRRGAYVPRGYELRVPAGTKQKFERELAVLAAEHAARMARAGTHRVQRGETLSDIAMRYGTSVRLLQRDNGIHDARRLRAGQVIKIPRRDKTGTATASLRKTPSASGKGARRASASKETGPIRHRVRRGQTLSHIARRYGTSVSTLKRHNGIRDSRRLRAGQVIRIPQRDTAGIITASAGNTPAGAGKQRLGSESTQAAASAKGAGSVRHRVRRGQTLSDISKRYGTTVGTLKRHNGIRDSRRLRAGQVIEIPTGDGPGAVATASKGPDKIRHKVSRGQTLSDIAKRYGTTVGTLKRHNGIRDSRRLRAGQVIVVASANTSTDDAGFIWHRVQRGQTLSHIAKKYGTSVRTLKRHNGIRDARRLRARQVIKVPTG